MKTPKILTKAYRKGLVAYATACVTAAAFLVDPDIALVHGTAAKALKALIGFAGAYGVVKARNVASDA